MFYSYSFFPQINLNHSLIFILIFLFLVVNFSSVNARINKNNLKIKFGIGLIRKSFKLKDILSAKAVRNHWYFGWGIRYWFWPRMTIYNVSGFDAVEIKMKNGRIYRIGTDEARKLEHAIIQSIKR